ncbi:TPA: dihydrofolate reductase family protein [Klebsiella michiganensis]
MNRPTINLYMESSLDGKSVGSFWDNERGEEYIEKYWTYYDKMDPQGFIIGRVSVQDWTYLLEEGNTLNLSDNVDSIPRDDFIAKTDLNKYIIAIDGSGKLAWKTNTKEAVADHLQNQSMRAHHIITVLTEEVSDAYLQHLRKLKISYIFGGKDKIDLYVVMEKLYQLLGLKDVILMGGSRLNGSFIRENLIDKYTTLVQASISGGDCNTPTRTTIEANLGQGYMAPVDFVIEKVEQLDNTGLFMSFIKK